MSEVDKAFVGIVLAINTLGVVWALHMIHRHLEQHLAWVEMWSDVLKQVAQVEYMEYIEHLDCSCGAGDDADLKDHATDCVVVQWANNAANNAEEFFKSKREGSL